MSKTDQILLKMQTAQSLRWHDPALAELVARSAIEDARALGVVSATLLANNLARCLRAALRSALRAEDDPAIPRLYALLSQGGETTFACHLTMIRHALATNKIPRALELAEAVAALYPDEPQAWSMLAEAAQAAGNEARAEQAELQLRVLGLVPGFRAPTWEKA